MPSNFSLAKQCQVLGSELAQIALLSTRMMLPSQGPTDALASTGTSASVDAAVRGLLTETHVRTLATNALVRVLIPRKRAPALILANPYVQLELGESSKASDSNKAQHSTAPTAGGEPPRAEAVSMLHRVGRIVAIILKPGSVVSPHEVSDVSTIVGSWLVAVHLGECVEVFSLKAISEEAFTEAEHRVYVRSTLGTAHNNANSGVATGAVMNHNVLLSTEQAEALKVSIKELRTAIAIAFAVDTDGKEAAAAVAEQGCHVLVRSLRERALATTAAAMASAGGRKRTRQEMERGGEEEGEEGDEEGTRVAAAGVRGEGRSKEGELAEGKSYRDRIARLEAGMRELRAQLNSKETEVRNGIQKISQARLQFEEELAECRVKLTEEGQARKREQEEAHQRQSEQARLASEAEDRIKKLAAMVMKHRAVTERVAGLLGGELDPKMAMQKPEMVLELLRRKTAIQ